MARDWRWAPASYRGVSFYVRNAAPSGGRRLAVHEYPGAEDHDVEDMGRSAPKFSVTAYLIGEAPDAQLAALLSALDQEGAGLLILPMFGAKLVRPEKWSPGWQDGRLNEVSLQIDFVAEGTANAPFPLALGERIISGLLGGLAPILGAAITAKFVAVDASSYAFKDAADALVTTGATAEALRTSLPISDDVSRKAGQKIADTVAALNGTGLPDPGATAAVLLDRIDRIVADLPDGAGADVLAEATSYVAGLANAASDRIRVSDEGASIYVAAAVMAAAETIRILGAATTYQTRSDAIGARRRMREVAAEVLPIYGALGDQVVRAFNDIWGQAAEHLSRTITTLSPIILVEAPRALPSTLIAYRLYADPTRAAELVARNAVGTPFLMPTIIEAAST